MYVVSHLYPFADFRGIYNILRRFGYFYSLTKDIIINLWNYSERESSGF